MTCDEWKKDLNKIWGSFWNDHCSEQDFGGDGYYCEICPDEVKNVCKAFSSLFDKINDLERSLKPKPKPYMRMEIHTINGEKIYDSFDDEE